MLLDNSKPYITTINELLTQQECDSLIKFINDSDPSLAPVTTFHGEQYRPEIRNNQRVMKEDFSLAKLLFQRAEPKLPQVIHGFSLVGLNELFRCYRYKPGMQFKPHSDTFYERCATERSFYTFLIYLNEVDSGGDTAFIVEPEVRVSPRAGRGVVFQHPIVHEGCEVLSGIKYVLRTDVMYRKIA